MRVVIPESEIDISTSRSGGPGGQHVNKTNTRVTLRWNILKTAILDDAQKQRCLSKLRTRINLEGEIVLHVDMLRSQIMNRELAFERLHELVTQALIIPKKRVKTKPSKASKVRRLEQKKKTGLQKKERLLSSKSYD
ncbi:MAG: alternative ribosome rescue aminoacyl-tRNA hydrolase ArfB [Myxococcaceae bacterium]